MKNLIKLFGLIALAAVIGFSFAFISCGDPASGPSTPEPSTPELTPPPPTSAIYESSSSDGLYILEITSEASRSIRAVYNPKGGDSYILTYIPNSGNIIKSSGKVQTTGNTLTLQPNKSGTPTFTVTVSGETMTAITGTITVTEGEEATIPAVATLTPTERKPPATIPLYGFKIWEDPDSIIHGNWSCARYKYRDFTKAKLKAGDTLRLHIRGTIDKPLNSFAIDFCTPNFTEWGWRSFGETAKINLSKSFDETMVITITEAPSPDEIYDDIYLATMNSDLLLKPDEVDKVMATISNFEIRLAGITPASP
jgi:hypothetical protein